MVKSVFLAMALLAGCLASPVLAQQQQVWVQIEAQPDRQQAEARAQIYANRLTDVVGYALDSGWYGIELGPYTKPEAEAKLSTLMDLGEIPADSFIADGHAFLGQYWPPNAQPAAPATAGDISSSPLQTAPATTQPMITTPAPDAGQAQSPAQTLAASQTPATGPSQPAETPDQALQGEYLMSHAEKQDVQRALAWFGDYAGRIDGAFGPGTRAAMATWQTSQSLDATGILTTAQRHSLMQAYRRQEARAGMQAVTDDNAGIAIDLPMAMVGFSRYAPPFARYDATGGSGVRVLLISAPGGQATLSDLYTQLQRLALVPPAGPRDLTADGFDITGHSANRTTHVHARIVGQAVKGYLLSWRTGQDRLMAHVLAAMKDSFRATGAQTLDAGMVSLSDGQKAGMIAGLALRKPVIARSGFYIDATGDVLTTTEVLKHCGQVTLGDNHPATVALRDDSLGLALLRPKTPLAPLAHATRVSLTPATTERVAVAGYPYQGVLPGAALTFGAFDAPTGLKGEPALRRLSLAAEPGNDGGPVLDDKGALVGMLLPPSRDGTVLPAKVRFALGAGPIATALAAKGITLDTAEPRPSGMAPEDLARLGRKMTVLVSCWK